MEIREVKHAFKLETGLFLSPEWHPYERAWNDSFPGFASRSCATEVNVPAWRFGEEHPFSGVIHLPRRRDSPKESPGYER